VGANGPFLGAGTYRLSSLPLLLGDQIAHGELDQARDPEKLR
jgi:hypothetical protein